MKFGPLDFSKIRTYPVAERDNKVNVEAFATPHVAGSSLAAFLAALPDAVKQRLAKKCDQRITESGEIIIQAQRFRSQEQNREDARQRLAESFETALRHADGRALLVEHDKTGNPVRQANAWH